MSNAKVQMRGTDKANPVPSCASTHRGVILGVVRYERPKSTTQGAALAPALRLCFESAETPSGWLHLAVRSTLAS